VQYCANVTFAHGALKAAVKTMTHPSLISRLKNGAAFLEDRYGGAAIVMAPMTPIIIGGLAYGAEVGGWQMTKRQIQNAADTAAFAAATQVRSGEDAATTTAVAKAVAEVSGYDGGSAGITVQHPPSTAPNAADGTDTPMATPPMCM
jgi:Flp pilus assembly protein TadG